MIRLDKLLSEMGAGSRKEVTKYIRSGSVTVDGEIIKSPDTKVSESADIVCMGEKIKYKQFFYIMLNKPQGYVTATKDNVNPTVLELIDDELLAKRVSPAGRLDIDTEGFVFLTDDGALNHKITGPKGHVRKRYYVELEKPLSEEQKDKLEKGVTLDDGYLTRPAKMEIINEHSCYLDLWEGKFHQVKRMFASVSNKVVYLKRTIIGSLPLDENLEPGEYREITDEELELLWT